MSPEPKPCCPAVEEVVDVSFYRALCDPSRAAILGRLAAVGGRGTVSEIAACCPLDLSVVSRHLATLRGAGIVIAEKRGREVHYRIDGTRAAGVLRKLADAIEHCCPAGGGMVSREGTGVERGRKR